MFTYLKQHPEIFVSVLKEPHFFGTDLTCQPHTVRDREVYGRFFEDASEGQICGEGSVWYLLSKKAATEIREICPGAKILIMLREPTAMLQSLHALYLRTGNEEIEDIEEAVAAEDERRQGRRIPTKAYFPEGLLYSEVASYTEKVRSYLEVFGDNVRIVLFDDFVTDTPAVYRDTASFLGVDPGFVPNWDLSAANMVMRMDVLRQMRKLPPELRRVMRGSGKRHLGKGPQMREAFRAELRQRFAADINSLSTLIGRDLGRWSA